MARLVPFFTILRQQIYVVKNAPVWSLCWKQQLALQNSYCTIRINNYYYTTVRRTSEFVGYKVYYFPAKLLLVVRMMMELLRLVNHGELDNYDARRGRREVASGRGGRVARFYVERSLCSRCGNYCIYILCLTQVIRPYTLTKTQPPEPDFNPSVKFSLATLKLLNSELCLCRLSCKISSPSLVK